MHSILRLRPWRVDVPGPLYPYWDDPDIISLADFVCYCQCFLVNLWSLKLWSSIMRLFEWNLTRVIAAFKLLALKWLAWQNLLKGPPGESSENNQVASLARDLIHNTAFNLWRILGGKKIEDSSWSRTWCIMGLSRQKTLSWTEQNITWISWVIQVFCY